MNVENEFETISLILASSASTRGVDAFALALIKAEKQARRLLTYLVYQHQWCSATTQKHLIKALATRRSIYIGGILRGWEALYPRTWAEIVGPEYARLHARLDEARRHRNKIFHGQLTGVGLGRPELLALVEDIRTWCIMVAEGAEREVGYGGIGRSFRKASDPVALVGKLKKRLNSLADYEAFLDTLKGNGQP